ncbi:hypothetical protein [Agarilytica rhodophyticola]|uniref:hypothetical protein n=1 Tax=Agarilytica rhodophyticola TaxID=1737490 RepID=UPI000CD81957|nr:hypothetical protein [Agarilytica rhodophyticola]
MPENDISPDLSRFSTIAQTVHRRLSERRDKANDANNTELAARIDREICGLQYGETIIKMLQQEDKKLYSNEDILGAIGMSSVCR